MLWVALLIVGGLLAISWESINRWVEARAEAKEIRYRVRRAEAELTEHEKLDQKANEVKTLMDQLPSSAHRERLRERLRNRTKTGVVQ